MVALFAALVALASASAAWAQGMGYPPGGYSIRRDIPEVGSHIPNRIISGSSIPFDKTWRELTPQEQRRWKEGNYEPMRDGDEPPFPVRGLGPMHQDLERLMRRLKQEGRMDLRVEGSMDLDLAVDPQGNVQSVKLWKSSHPELAKFFAGMLMFEKFKPALCGGNPCAMEFPLRIALSHRI
jgi:hypothetical protein